MLDKQFILTQYKARFVRCVLPSVIFAIIFFALYFAPTFRTQETIQTEKKVITPYSDQSSPQSVNSAALNVCFPNICSNSNNNNNNNGKRDVHQSGSVQEKFESIYAGALWGSGGGGSGLGSEPSYTLITRYIMEMVIYKYQITSLLDAPCGGIKWTRLLLAKIFEKIPCFKYHGIDVVRDVIKNLTFQFSSVPNIDFSIADLSFPGIKLPFGDLILCRDALQHLAYANIINILENFSKSKSKYLIVGSYPEGSNALIPTGII
jgi:hypothetical protein